MLGVDEVNEATPGWFPLRLPAIQRIWEKMTAAEQADICAEKEKMMKQGYPENKRRRYVQADADADADPNIDSSYSLAEKKLDQRIEEASRQHWLEMGVLSMTFTAHTDKNGSVVVSW